MSALLAVSAGYNGYPGSIDKLSDEQLNDVRTLLGVLDAGAPWARGGDSFDPSGLMSYIDQVQDYRDAVRRGDAAVAAYSKPGSQPVTPEQYMARIEELQRQLGAEKRFWRDGYWDSAGQGDWLTAERDYEIRHSRPMSFWEE